LRKSDETMIEVEVNSIRVSLTSQQRVVLLKDISAERYLPIWIGQFEAEAITSELQEKRLRKERPMTHDLLKNVIEEMGGKLVHILINDARADVYYARLVVDMDGNQIEIDSRPSDAIAIAVRAKAPIFVSDAVMQKSAVEPEEDVDLMRSRSEVEKPAAAIPARSAPEKRSEDLDVSDQDDEEEVDPSELGAFADFLNTLDLDELDQNDDD
jgi:uncharacterized protein